MKVLKCFVIVEVEVFSLLKLSLYFFCNQRFTILCTIYYTSVSIHLVKNLKKVDVFFKLLLRLSLRTFWVSSKGSSLRVF